MTWRLPEELDADKYHYDLESIAWASVGAIVHPNLTDRDADGFRRLIGVTYLNQIEGERGLMALLGCLDASL